MILQEVSRKQVRIRLGLQGPSGSGKTLGALMVAYGLCADWSKIAVVDTEFGSASLYSNVGPYMVLGFPPPYSPERYIDAIHLCESHGVEVIILDSISHEWESSGGILDIHNSMTGNSFTNWGKVTPRHNAFIQALLQSPCHIITTIRSKQDYVLSDKNGKMVPEKVGLKGVQRDGVEYELTTLFEIDIKHNVTASKDRTSLFSDKPEFKLTVATGQKLLGWCNQGTASDPEADILQRIAEVKTVEELLKLYKDSPAYQSLLQGAFSSRRKQLEVLRTVPQLLNPKNHSTNGQHDSVTR